MTRDKPTARSARTIRAKYRPSLHALHSESLAFALARDLPVIKPQTRKARIRGRGRVIGAEPSASDASLANLGCTC
jgi:hypothetical protein